MHLVAVFVGMGATAALATTVFGCAVCIKQLRTLQAEDGTIWGTIKHPTTTNNPKPPIIIQPDGTGIAIQIPTNPAHFSMETDDEEPKSGEVTPASWHSRSPRNSRVFQPGFDEVILEHDTLVIPDILGIHDEIRSKSATTSPDLERKKTPLRSSKSVTSLGSPVLQRKKTKLIRAISVPEFVSYHKPRLEFELMYNTEAHELTISNIQASDIGSLQITKPYVFVRCTLIPIGKIGTTEHRDVKGDVVFRHTLCFDELDNDEVHKSSLLMKLSATSGDGRRGMILAELMLNVSEIQCIDKVIHVDKPFQTSKRVKRVSLLSSYSIIYVTLNICPNLYLFVTIYDEMNSYSARKYTII